MYICLFRLQMQQGDQNNEIVHQMKKKTSVWRAAHWQYPAYKGQHCAINGYGMHHYYDKHDL